MSSLKQTTHKLNKDIYKFYKEKKKERGNTEIVSCSDFSRIIKEFNSFFINELITGTGISSLPSNIGYLKVEKLDVPIENEIIDFQLSKKKGKKMLAFRDKMAYLRWVKPIKTGTYRMASFYKFLAARANRKKITKMLDQNKLALLETKY